MTGQELAKNAEAYEQVLTCYLKGFWGQKLTYNSYNRIGKLYPVNASYHNEKYIMTDVFPFDCICFIKSLMAAGTINHRVSWEELKANPIGDCDNISFQKMLYDCCDPEKGKPGYGLATRNHAALCLGDGRWIDVNFNGSQNGVKIHEWFSGYGFICGKIPGVTYESEPLPTPGTTKYSAVLDQVRQGCYSQSVGLVQQLLNDYMDAGLEVDCECGPLTTKAICDYQELYDLDPDGIVGSKTWTSLLGVKVVIL